MVESYIDGGILGADDEDKEIKKELEERRKRKPKKSAYNDTEEINESDFIEYGD
jgi:hypothetical protein